MRLQKHYARTVKGKDYSKWVVVIPPKMIEDLGWKEGEELEPKTFHGGLILLPKKLKIK